MTLTQLELLEMPGCSGPLMKFIIQHMLRKAGFDLSKPFRWWDDYETMDRVFIQHEGGDAE